MNQTTQKIGKGSDDNLYRYRLKRERRRVFRRIVMPLAACMLLLLLTVLFLVFGFVVKDIEIVGVSHYTTEEILEKSGIGLKDNLFAISTVDVEERLKKEFPYIKSVKVEKHFPSALTLVITEEYTTFYYETEGEFFLFNYDLRLMDKFDSKEALWQERTPVLVEMPVPKSSIVPQYIQLREENTYVKEFITQLASSPMIGYVNAIDLTDKYSIGMVCKDGVVVELGDYIDTQEKLLALYKLLEGKGEKMSGTVDMTDYPRCFYDLESE